LTISDLQLPVFDGAEREEVERIGSKLCWRDGILMASDGALSVQKRFRL
jgi:hypothetical protein